MRQYTTHEPAFGRKMRRVMVGETSGPCLTDESP